MDEATALALHGAGRHAEAEAAYQAILAARPASPQALFGYGVLHYQRGDAAAAETWLTRAIGENDTTAEYYFNRGLARARLGRPAEAAADFAAASRLNPAWPEPHYDRANALAELGQTDAAVAAFRAALKLQPGFTQAEANLASLLHDTGQTAPALAAYRRLLARDANLPEVQNNYGALLRGQGDTIAAEAAFRHALRLDADFAPALNNLGALLIDIDPSRRDEGLALLRRAQSVLERRLAAGPATLKDRLLLASTLLECRAFAPAIAALRAAIAAHPAAVGARIELAGALNEAGHHAEALAALPDANGAKPDLKLLLCRAGVLQANGHASEAEAAFRAARRLAPQNLWAKFQLAFQRLRAGDLAEGFALFEARIKLFGHTPPGGLWDGTRPAGKHLVVHAEEGLGDTIQFARFVPDLLSRGARVTFRVPPALLRLVARLDGAAALRCAPNDVPVPAADGAALVMSLPRLLGVTERTLRPGPYLAADPARWQRWLGPAPRRRIGLAWSGNPDYGLDHLRSIPPALLAPLAAVPDVEWISLQRGAPAGAIPGLTLRVPDFIADLADTADLVAALDRVITVDTVIVHLAGALGRPTWLLDRANPDWRWGATKWYDSVRIFRQPHDHDWPAVIEKVVLSLKSEIP